MTIAESVPTNNNSRDSKSESALQSGMASLITIVALAWAMDLFQTFEIYLYPAQLVIAVLGFAYVSGSHHHAQEVVHKLLDVLRMHPAARLIEHELEVL